MPRLRILAGPSLTALTPIQANSSIPFKIASDAFEGEILVYIKGFADEEGRIGDSEYFEGKEGKEGKGGKEGRKGVTWSIQAQGEF